MKKRLIMESVVILVSLSFASACATGRSAHREAHNERLSGAMVVTAAELARILHPQSLMEALERLRPTMLRSRGGTPMVSVDGAPATDPSILRSIAVSAVREVRLLRAAWSAGTPAVTAQGHVVVGDLLVVSTWSAAR